MTNFAIPDNVSTIGARAFSMCTGLQNLTVPKDVETINSYTFQSCNSVTFAKGSKLKTIGDSAFNGCQFTEITIPASVTEIQDYAFADFRKLQSLKFEEGSQIQTIGNSIFYMCYGLTDIMIPASVKTIEDRTFYYCTALTTVYYGGKTASDWGAINIGSIGNTPLTNAARYYYSKNKPTDGNNYWRYVDGVPTIWSALSTETAAAALSNEASYYMMIDEPQIEEPTQQNTAEQEIQTVLEEDTASKPEAEEPETKESIPLVDAALPNTTDKGKSNTNSSPDGEGVE